MPISPAQLAVNGNLVDVAYEVTLDPNDAVFITQEGTLVTWPLESDEAVYFVGSKPADTSGNNNDQAIVISGDTHGMVFEKLSGTWTYRTQASTPMLLTAPTPATVAADLPSATDQYWYYLYGQADLAKNGHYFVNGSAIVSGPYAAGSGVVGELDMALGGLTDVDATDFTSGYVLTRKGDGSFEMLAVSASEINDLTSSVTWANIPDANVPASAVTQHEAAITITESQISDLSAIAATDIDTLAELNAIITDATLIDTGDARLSDSRTCDNTFDTAATARTNLDVYSTGEVDGLVVGLYEHKGGYNAATNTPDLDTSPSGVKKGDAYTVSVVGTFFTEALEVGDVLISDQDDPTLLSHWTIVNKNLSFGTTAGTACEGDDSRLSDARTPTAHTHVEADITDLQSYLLAADIDTLAEVNAIITDATLIDTGDARLSDARTPTAHTHVEADITDLGSYLAAADIDTLAEVNAIITDATLIDTGDSRLSDARTPTAHTHVEADITDLQSYLLAADIDTLAEVNAIITDATLIDTGDARLSDARTPTAHTLGGAEHSADTLANLNLKVSDATLIDTGDSRLSDARTPTAHTHVEADITDLGSYLTTTAAASNANGQGASLIGIEDAAAGITATDVEAALAEIMGDLDASQTALGVADGATDIGAFTTDIITDNVTVAAALEEVGQAVQDRTLAHGTEQTITFNAAIGTDYSVDTGGGAITANLPAGSASLDGKSIIFRDTPGNWGNANLTISPNGTEFLNGVNTDQVVADNYGVVTLTWDNDNSTWIFTKQLPTYAGAVVTMSATVSGIGELATSAEVLAGTATGGTGDPLVVAPDTLKSNYTTSADAASTTNGKGASLVGIEDAAGDITAGTVEGALAELAANNKDASETIKGHVELATDAEMAAASVSATGGVGPLAAKAQQVGLHMNSAGTQWALRGTTLTATSAGWSTVNVSTSKTFDADGTLAHIGDTVGTILDVLLAHGLISA